MTQQDDSSRQPEGRAPGQGFTPERDRKMIMLSCGMLLVMSLAIFLMVNGRLRQLSDVTGAYAQVGLTAASTIREQATDVRAGFLIEEPNENTAQWLTSRGQVAMVHDKKGDPINWESPNAAMGSVYWLECGLPVTAVKPLAPVCEPGGYIRFWGQVAVTEVGKLEFSEELQEKVMQRFGLQEGQEIPIFFASEIELTERLSPLKEEVDLLEQQRHELGH